MKLWIHLAVAALVLLGPLNAVVAQQTPHATIQLDRDSVDLGDSFIYGITIDGAQSAEQPQFPASDTYKAEFLGGWDESSHSIFTINGHTTESNILRYRMQWRITPLKLGRGVVRGFSIGVGSQTLSIPQAEFQVSEPGANPYFQLSLEP